MKVSVCMVSCNHALYIRQALESILAQRCTFEWQIIIGDDASADDTPQILEAYQKRYPQRITLLKREKNLGIKQNVYETLMRCEGEYIALCEGDDFWNDNHKLQKQADFLDANSACSLVYHNVYIKNEGNNKTWLKKNSPVPKDDNLHTLAAFNFINTVSAVFRKECLSDLPDLDTRNNIIDYLIFLNCAKYGTLHYLPEPMATYRIHQVAVWSGLDDAARWWQLVDFLNTVIPYYPGVDRELTDHRNRGLVHYLMSMKNDPDKLANELSDLYKNAGYADGLHQFIVALAATHNQQPGLKAMTKSMIKKVSGRFEKIRKN